jgi:hypothetical protein
MQLAAFTDPLKFFRFGYFDLFSHTGDYVALAEQ